MIYFDTNILIYNSIEQDLNKSILSEQLIKKAILDVLNSYKNCLKFNKCRNINDFIHLEIANKHCEKIITFNSDFKNLQKFYDIEIEILT